MVPRSYRSQSGARVPNFDIVDHNVAPGQTRV